MEHWRGFLIAGGILLFFLLLFCAPIRLYVRYEETGWTIRGRYLCVPFAVFPRPEKREKNGKTGKIRKKEQKINWTADRPQACAQEACEQKQPVLLSPETSEQKAKPEQTEKAPAPKKKPRKKFDGDAFFAKMGQIAAGVRSGTKPVLLFLHRVKADRIVFTGRVSGENAADTALKYGGVFALWNSLLAFFASVMRVKIAQPDLQADYEAQEPQMIVSGSFRLSAPLWAALSLLLFGGGRVLFAVKDIQDSQEAQRQTQRAPAE